KQIAKEGLAEKILRSPVVMTPCSFSPQFSPILDRAVPAAKAHQGDEIDLLVGAQRIDEARNLTDNRIMAVILEHVDHAVIGTVRSSIRINQPFLDVEFARFDDEKFHLVRGDREFWHSPTPFVERRKTNARRAMMIHA